GNCDVGLSSRYTRSTIGCCRSDRFPCRSWHGTFSTGRAQRMSPMRRREFLRWAATSASALGLAACQAGAPSTPTAAPTTAPPPKPPTAPPAAPTTAPAAKPTVAPTMVPAAASGGTLVYGLSGDFDDTLDPQVTNFDTSIRVTLNICEPLVWEPEPG